MGGQRKPAMLFCASSVERFPEQLSFRKQILDSTMEGVQVRVVFVVTLVQYS